MNNWTDLIVAIDVAVIPVIGTVSKVDNDKETNKQ
jgi:hypothetical protein